MVLVKNDHPLAGLRAVQEEDLAGFPEISPGRQSVPYLGEDAQRLSAGSGFVCPGGLNRLAMLTALPNAYLKCAPVTGEFCRQRGLTALHLNGADRFKDLLIHRRNMDFSPAELAFIDRLFEARNAVAFGKGGDDR